MLSLPFLDKHKSKWATIATSTDCANVAKSQESDWTAIW